MVRKRAIKTKIIMPQKYKKQLRKKRLRVHAKKHHLVPLNLEMSNSKGPSKARVQF